MKSFVHRQEYERYNLDKKFTEIFQYVNGQLILR